MTFRIAVLTLGAGFCVSACTQQQTPLTEAELLQKRGRLVYQTHCTACHASNPRNVGSVGPEVYGASLELLKSRILTKGYPQGYQPKRTTHVMPALPHLEQDIPSLHQFLNTP